MTRTPATSVCAGIAGCPTNRQYLSLSFQGRTKPFKKLKKNNQLIDDNIMNNLITIKEYLDFDEKDVIN